MNKRFIYFLTGALLCGLVLVVFQVTQASPVAPNPGHALSCHIEKTTTTGWGEVSRKCETGTLTGVGCSCSPSMDITNGPLPMLIDDELAAYCFYGVSGSTVTAYAICCEAI